MRICQPPENVSDRLPQIVGGEAETAQDGGDLQVDAVALEPAEGLLQIAVALQHRAHGPSSECVVAEPLFERGDLVAHVEQRLEGEAGLLDQRAAAVVEAVLRQVADGQPGRLDDRAGVGLLEPGEHLEQRGLAGAVRAAEADALAVVDLPADRVEQDAAAEGLAEGTSWINLRFRRAPSPPPRGRAEPGRAS